MKRIPVIYPLLLVFIGGSALLAFSRINKVNFYHHYYRVIEEVQTRNSQEWEAKALTLQVFSDFKVTPQSVAGDISSASGLFSPKVGLFALPYTRRLEFIRPTSIWYLNASPAQAP